MSECSLRDYKISMAVYEAQKGIRDESINNTYIDNYVYVMADNR